jgi:hypothetical protein
MVNEEGPTTSRGGCAFAETLADSYKVIYGQAAESTERQQRLAGRSRNSWRATSGSRPRAGAPPPNAYPSRPANTRGRAGVGTGVRRSLHRVFGCRLLAVSDRYRAGRGSVQEGAMATGGPHTTWWEPQPAPRAAPWTPDRECRTDGRDGHLPIAGYDEMNVEEVSRDWTPSPTSRYDGSGTTSALIRTAKPSWSASRAG